MSEAKLASLKRVYQINRLLALMGRFHLRFAWGLEQFLRAELTFRGLKYFVLSFIWTPCKIESIVLRNNNDVGGAEILTRYSRRTLLGELEPLFLTSFCPKHSLRCATTRYGPALPRHIPGRVVESRSLGRTKGTSFFLEVFRRPKVRSSWVEPL